MSHFGMLCTWTDRFEVTASAVAASAGGPLRVAAVACDDGHVFVLSNHGLFKIGTGVAGAAKGAIVAMNSNVKAELSGRSALWSELSLLLPIQKHTASHTHHLTCDTPCACANSA